MKSQTVPFRQAVFLVAIVAGAAVLAVQQLRHPPANAGLDAQLAAAYRYIDHMALNLARNSLRRTETLFGRRRAVRDAEALVAALEAWRRSGDGTALLELAVERRGEASVQIALGRLAASGGDAGQARAYYEQALGQAPDNVAARLELGKALLGLGRDEDALRHLAMAHEGRGKFHYVAWEYALALVAQGQARAAIPVLESLVDDNPGNLNYALQYLAAAVGHVCTPTVVRILDETTAYFGNDLTMQLGDNDEPWRLVIEAKRIRLTDRESKREALARIRLELDETSCGA